MTGRGGHRNHVYQTRGHAGLATAVVAPAQDRAINFDGAGMKVPGGDYCPAPYGSQYEQEEQKHSQTEPEVSYSEKSV